MYQWKKKLAKLKAAARFKAAARLAKMSLKYSENDENDNDHGDSGSGQNESN